MEGPLPDPSPPPPDPEAIPSVVPIPLADDPWMAQPDEAAALVPVLPESTDVVRTAKPALKSQIIFWLCMFAGGFLYLALFIVPGETRKFATAGLNPLPFLGLALVAYLGKSYDWAKILSAVYLCLFLMGTGFIVFILALMLGGGVVQVGGCILGLGLAVVAAALCFLPPVRVFLARYIPIDAGSWVETIALATVVGFALICLAPLVAFGQPVILLLLKQYPSIGEEIAKSDMLRDQLYGLVWLVPAAFLAVGYPLYRDFRTTRERLGLVRPSLLQVAVGLGTAIVLVGAMFGLEQGMAWLWTRLGWPRTDEKTFTELIQFAINPVGALVIGFTAGLGEELAIRGVLQPRLGILLSNLLFAAMHAFQYNFDGLLAVFLLGLVFGIVRKRTNTTTSAIVHGTYDAVLVFLAYLEAQGMLNW